MATAGQPEEAAAVEAMEAAAAAAVVAASGQATVDEINNNCKRNSAAIGRLTEQNENESPEHLQDAQAQGQGTRLIAEPANLADRVAQTGAISANGPLQGSKLSGQPADESAAAAAEANSANSNKTSNVGARTTTASSAGRAATMTADSSDNSAEAGSAAGAASTRRHPNQQSPNEQQLELSQQQQRQQHEKQVPSSTAEPQQHFVSISLPQTSEGRQQQSNCDQLADTREPAVVVERAATDSSSSSSSNSSSSSSNSSSSSSSSSNSSNSSSSNSSNNNNDNNNNNNSNHSHPSHPESVYKSSSIVASSQSQSTTTPALVNNNSQSNQTNETLFLNRFELISASGRKLVPQELCLQKQELSYLQGLLIRKWPFLPLALLAMFTLLIVGALLALDGRWQSCSVEAGSRPAAVLAGASEPALMNLPLIGSHKSRYFGSSAAEPSASLHSGATGSSGGPAELPQSPEARDLAARVDGGDKPSPLAAPQANASAFQRLPTSVWPIHYDLFIQPHIVEPFNFSGRVAIRLECREPTDNITLHSIDLAFNESTLSLELLGAGNRSRRHSRAPKVKSLSQDKQLQHSIISLEDKLEAGREYVLHINFKGNLHEDLSGFYKIKYEQQNSTEPTWIAATQFQATDARRAFPCFDEPNYKATFSIQIKHWKNMTALSNMPIIDRQDSADGLWVTDSFDKSHRMSTYLVAFAVTNFESRTDGNISVWTRPGFAHTAEYALRVAKRILSFYESFFGIDYPLPKMDMIALPDFNAGAMENWGLITYRETTMLYDELSSSIVNKQRVAVVVAHELAHQWFGNLVTPKWWDDLWLNEGFASYVEYIGVDHIEPGWRMLDQFVVDEVHNVLKLDCLSSSHQISIPVTNPDEISEIFDHISYAKGASVIRMMSHFLSEQVFKTGLTRYLRALKYRNAEQSDLWAHLTEAQKLSNSSTAMVNVERVMNSWTLQIGYPLVSLTRQYNGSNQVTLAQIHYQPYKFQHQQQANLSIDNQTLDLSNQRWEIPITFTSKSELNWEPRTRLWMHQNDSKLSLDGASEFGLKSDEDWILLNIDQTGYYRVNYDKRNWKLLIDQLNSDHKVIKNTNRAQMLDDLFELARGSVIDYKFAMEATKYLRRERDYLPWDAVLSSFAYIDDMLQRTAIYGDWKDYILALIAPYYARYKDLDWNLVKNNTAFSSNNTGSTSPADDNDLIEQYNHANAIYWACSVDEHCVQKAKSLFQKWKQGNTNQINPAFRHTVYCTAIQNGNKDDWHFLWKVYEKEQNASEKDRLMRALCCSKETWILARYLEWTFDKTKSIRRQDGAYVFRLIAKNIHGRDIAFNFMRERWSTIKEFYGKSSFSLGNLIRSVAYLMNTQVELNQLVSFYEAIKSDVGNGKRSFQIAIEEVESNVSWRNRNYKILGDWLAEVRGKMTSSVPMRR